MKKLIFFLFFSISCFGQQYMAIYEDGYGNKKYWGKSDLVFTDKKVIIHYKNAINHKSAFIYPIINKYTQYYIMTRNTKNQETDFWIISQKRYKIVRIWSNQKTGRFGRITYYKMLK